MVGWDPLIKVTTDCHNSHLKSLMTAHVHVILMETLDVDFIISQASLNPSRLIYFFFSSGIVKRRAG